MNFQTKLESESAEKNLVVLAALALVVGGVAGVVGALFRLALLAADRLRDLIVVWAQGRALIGLLCVVALCALGTLAAAWLVRRFSPHASGSGIPHVEAVLHGLAPPAPFILLPNKVVSGRVPPAHATFPAAWGNDMEQHEWRRQGGPGAFAI